MKVEYNSATFTFVFYSAKEESCNFRNNYEMVLTFPLEKVQKIIWKEILRVKLEVLYKNFKFKTTAYIFHWICYWNHQVTEDVKLAQKYQLHRIVHSTAMQNKIDKKPQNCYT